MSDLHIEQEADLSETFPTWILMRYMSYTQ